MTYEKGTLCSWEGGKMPVSQKTSVRVYLRGEGGWHGEVHPADHCYWGHDESDHDIVAFELVGDEK